MQSAVVASGRDVLDFTILIVKKFVNLKNRGNIGIGVGKAVKRVHRVQGVTII
jgi:hypothetical protein